jgi:hypothetical protein
MASKKWTADVIKHPKVAAFTHVALHGPELDDHDHELIDRLAGNLFDYFCDYVAARNALELACKEKGEPSEYDLVRKAAAWDRLIGEIDTGLLLPPAESRLVSQVLDEACGRVWTAVEK